MRVFVQRDKLTGEFVNENAYNAFFGFQKMGRVIVSYYTPPEEFSREDIVVGYITSIKQALRNIGIDPPTEIDYPEELSEFYGRKLWTSNLWNVANSPEMYPVFIKPVSGKQFNGTLVTGFKDLIGCGNCVDDPKIWCSEPVNFVSEYRCFVRYGKYIGVRIYKGDWRKVPNQYVMNACLEAYKNAPAGCSLDFGVTEDGRTLLIEVNDGYALGSYGLFSTDYAKLISARWSQITNVPDRCIF